MAMNYPREAKDERLGFGWWVPLLQLHLIKMTRSMLGCEFQYMQCELGLGLHVVLLISAPPICANVYSFSFSFRRNMLS